MTDPLQPVVGVAPTTPTQPASTPNPDAEAQAALESAAAQLSAPAVTSTPSLTIPSALTTPPGKTLAQPQPLPAVPVEAPPVATAPQPQPLPAVPVEQPGLPQTPQPQPLPLPTPPTAPLNPPGLAATTPTPAPQGGLTPDAEQKLNEILGKNEQPSAVPRGLIYAILGGIVLLALGVGAYFLFGRAKQKSSVALETPAPSAAVVAKAAELFITVDTFSGKAMAVDDEVLIKGKTLPNTTVLIYSDVDEASVDSDSKGNFEGTVILGESGLVRVSAFSENGEEAEATLSMTEGKVQGLTDTAITKKASESAVKKVSTSDTSKDKQATAKVFVHEASASTQQELTTPTSFPPEYVTPSEKPVKRGAAALKTLLSKESTGSGITREEDVAIKPLAVKTATSGATLKRKAAMGIVKAVDPRYYTLQHPTKAERLSKIFTTASTTVTAKGSTNQAVTVTVGMRVVVVGEPTAGGLMATRIHVISGKATGLSNSSTTTASPKPKATKKPQGTLPPSASASASPRVSPSASASATRR